MIQKMLINLPNELLRSSDIIENSIIPLDIRQRYGIEGTNTYQGKYRFIYIAELIETAVINPIVAHADLVGTRLINILEHKFSLRDYVTFSECMFFFKDGHSSQYQLNVLTDIV